MKVIHFIRSIDQTGGGTTAYMKLLAENLVGKIDQLIVTAESPNPVVINDVETKFFAMSVKRWFSLKKEFTDFLQNENPDIVHINGIWSPENAIFQQCAQKSGIKVILSPHGMLEPYILNRHKWKKKLALAIYQQKALKNSGFFHATADAELQQIRKLGYKQETFVVPNGIDTKEILQKVEFRKEGAPLKLLFLSRIHPKKGIELLLKVLSELQNSNLLLQIVGNGEKEYIDKLQLQSKSLGIDDKVKFIGPVYGQQKWELLQMSDIFVLPTYSENFGIVVAEALATGIPVITTTGTPWKELNTENCGWWIELGVDNLKKTINQALNSSPSELQKMGVTGKQLIEKAYNINIVAEQFIKTYQYIKNLSI